MEAEEIVLPPNHYIVPITYAPMPPFTHLEREFGEKKVSVIFADRMWQLHSSCVGMNRTPGKRIFFVHDVGHGWEREDQIVWGLNQRSAVAPSGYRTAIPEELYEFLKVHPELTNLVALGSSTMLHGFQYVAGVWSYGGQRILVSHHIVLGFLAKDRVLFVRK